MARTSAGKRDSRRHSGMGLLLLSWATIVAVYFEVNLSHTVKKNKSRVVERDGLRRFQVFDNALDGRVGKRKRHSWEAFKIM